jgi:hypothetical protein
MLGQFSALNVLPNPIDHITIVFGSTCVIEVLQRLRQFLAERFEGHGPFVLVY